MAKKEVTLPEKGAILYPIKPLVRDIYCERHNISDDGKGLTVQASGKTDNNKIVWVSFEEKDGVYRLVDFCPQPRQQTPILTMRTT